MAKRLSGKRVVSIYAELRGRNSHVTGVEYSVERGIVIYLDVEPEKLPGIDREIQGIPIEYRKGKLRPIGTEIDGPKDGDRGDMIVFWGPTKSY